MTTRRRFLQWLGFGAAAAVLPSSPRTTSAAEVAESLGEDLKSAIRRVKDREYSIDRGGQIAVHVPLLFIGHIIAREGYVKFDRGIFKIENELGLTNADMGKAVYINAEGTLTFLPELGRLPG